MSTANIKEVVREKYGEAATRVQSGRTSCCGTGAALEGGCDPITSNLYSAGESGEVPEPALRALGAVIQRRSQS